MIGGYLVFANFIILYFAAITQVPAQNTAKLF